MNLSTGLQQMHEQGTVHRDIKPGNVRLRGGDWTDPVLVDFGSVRIQGGSVTPSLGAHGTARYMAREVAQSLRNAVPASDQYSLACVALEATAVALNGSPEDAHDSERDRLLDRLGEELPTLSQVFRRALAPAPVERFPSVLVFAGTYRDAAIADAWVEPVPVPGQGASLPAGESLIEFFARLDLPTVDKRPKGGKLWVVANRDEFQSAREVLSSAGILFEYVAAGGRASKGKPAWFTASSA